MKVQDKQSNNASNPTGQKHIYLITLLFSAHCPPPSLQHSPPTPVPLVALYIVSWSNLILLSKAGHWTTNRFLNTLQVLILVRNRQIDIQIYRYTDTKQIDSQLDKQINEWIDILIDRHRDKQLDRYNHRQID